MRKKGFTLIELLISSAVFILIITLLIGLFAQIFKAQSKVITSQQLLDQTSYALEYMGRFLRMAKKSQDGECLSASGLNYEIFSAGGEPGGGIRFLSSKTKCQEFFLENGQIKSRTSWNTSKTGFGSALSLTSDKFLIEPGSLKFAIQGEQLGDNLQPRATIFMEIGRNPDLKPKIQLQTTVSQRNLDIP